MIKKLLALLLIPSMLFAAPQSGLNKKDWGAFEFFVYHWPLRSSRGMLYFDFPAASAGLPTDWIAYLITPDLDTSGTPTGPLPAPLHGGQTITVTAQTIVTHGNPVFRYDTEPGNTCVFPPHARPYIARRGWIARNYEYDRWWANPTAINIAPGPSQTINVSVDPAQWTSVFGRRGDESLEATSAFYATFADPESIGLSLGGGCFFGHGIYVDGGKAQFVVQDWSVQ